MLLLFGRMINNTRLKNSEIRVLQPQSWYISTQTPSMSHERMPALKPLSKKPTSTGVVLYYSKALNSAQTRYSGTERELIAASTVITQLRHYLLRKKFKLLTDHAAQSHKEPHEWRLCLQPLESSVSNQIAVLYLRLLASS